MPVHTRSGGRTTARSGGGSGWWGDAVFCAARNAEFELLVAFVFAVVLYMLHGLTHFYGIASTAENFATRPQVRL